jgi:hypothetical protein
MIVLAVLAVVYCVIVINTTIEWLGQEGVW